MNWGGNVIAAIVITVFVVTLIFQCRKHRNFIKHYIGEILFFSCAAAVGTFCALILFGVMCANISGPAEMVEVESTIELYAVNDYIGEHGRFYLGSGHIDNDEYYYYVVKTEDGGFITKKIESDMAVLYYTEDEPKIEVCRYKFTNPIHNFLSFGVCQTERKYKIYIPEGTIIHDYKVDLR